MVAGYGRRGVMHIYPGRLGLILRWSRNTNWLDRVGVIHGWPKMDCFSMRGT